MAKVKPLNDTQIKNAKSTGKVGGDWLADGNKRYLVVMPTDNRIWKFRYLTPFKKTKIPTQSVTTQKFHLHVDERKK